VQRTEWPVSLPTARDPLLEAVDLHGVHDFRHTFPTWLEDAGIRPGSSTNLWATSAAGTATWMVAAGSAPVTGTPPMPWPFE
jgi:hypothetical protein